MTTEPSHPALPRPCSLGGLSNSDNRHSSALSSWTCLALATLRTRIPCASRTPEWLRSPVVIVAPQDDKSQFRILPAKQRGIVALTVALTVPRQLVEQAALSTLQGQDPKDFTGLREQARF